MTTVVYTDMPFFVERGRMPFELGVFDGYNWKVVSPAGLAPRTGKLAQAFPGKLFYAAAVPGPGYHWYTLPAYTTRPTRSRSGRHTGTSACGGRTTRMGARSNPTCSVSTAWCW